MLDGTGLVPIVILTPSCTAVIIATAILLIAHLGKILRTLGPALMNRTAGPLINYRVAEGSVKTMQLLIFCWPLP